MNQHMLLVLCRLLFRLKLKNEVLECLIVQTRHHPPKDSPFDIWSYFKYLGQMGLRVELQGAV